MALLGVRSLFAFRIETLAAAARGPVVRVAYEEAAARDALGIVDARSVEVLLAVSVHEDLEPVDLHDLVALVDRPVEGQAIPESGAATAGDVHPEVRVLRRPEGLARVRVVPLDELLDLVCGGPGPPEFENSGPPLPLYNDPLYHLFVAAFL